MRPALDILVERGQSVSELLSALKMNGGDPNQYPDGSIQTDSKDEVIRVTIGRGLGCQSFRSLAPFPRTWYAYFYPESYEELAGEGGFNVSPRVPIPSPDEYDLHELKVSVVFHRKPNEDVMKLFADSLQKWRNSVSEHGMFSEGPVKGISPTIQFRRHLAQFTIDASVSGQNTLNWLTLSIFNFGVGMAPISSLIYDEKNGPFGDSENNIERVFGVEKVKPVLVPLPDALGDHARNAPVTVAISPSKPPPGMSSHPIAKSRSFPIWMTPRYHWDDLHIVVAFVPNPDADQRKEFKRAIESWFTIGEFGGLGGRGIDSHSAIKFTGNMARFVGDMGDAQESIALETLVRILEGYDSTTAPIEFVQLGKSVEE